VILSAGLAAGGQHHSQGGDRGDDHRQRHHSHQLTHVRLGTHRPVKKEGLGLGFLANIPPQCRVVLNSKCLSLWLVVEGPGFSVYVTSVQLSTHVMCWSVQKLRCESIKIFLNFTCQVTISAVIELGQVRRDCDALGTLINAAFRAHERFQIWAIWDLWMVDLENNGQDALYLS
jgi:hypothetical protein